MEGWQLITQLQASLSSPGPGFCVSGREISEDLAQCRQ